MKTLMKEEILGNKERFLKEIEKGAVFIHPTDTIYGIGCNAADKKCVEKIREMKKRQEMPFSIIAPSKNWIYSNCIVAGNAKEWIKKLPGPYTLILKLKNKKAIADNVNLGAETIGVRIPKHWISKLVQELNIPVVSTSANITGENFMTSLANMDSIIKRKVDFIIYEGEKKGKPSTLVKLFDEKVEVIER